MVSGVPKEGTRLFRYVPYERYGQKILAGLESIPADWVGQRVGYRHGLVLWLNRALSKTLADREAADRVGTLINGLNISNAKWLDSDNVWIRKSRKATGFKSLKELARYYKFEIDLHPSGDGARWGLDLNCVDAPSGDGSELRARFDDLIAQDGICNPEMLAVEAVIHSALEGRLGTIRRCEVGSCGKWFLTKKDDARRRCCPEHDVDDLRSGTPERKEQNRKAAKSARKSAKDEDERQRMASRPAGLVRPGRRRAKYKTERP
jgi:hypothetical protein